MVRVISDGAPNVATSRAENAPTRWKIPARTSRPNAMDVRAPKRTAMTEQMICSSDTASIQEPAVTM